ncbi:CpsD/CapB family tyrosine-protein kinase [Piscibacillus halophilus]|uniref:CpsD/CapB family tyrosine-protein kinase n=1 Tax=Piscibacillus halophilus TaxID=571933 RepID=UPI0024843EEE|nr:CpsD/CapB family tyrosine-protein kinase [Piscibacillus halophilus]
MARNSKLRNPHTRTLIARDQVKSPITEQYRTIRTNMQFSAIDEDLRSVLVTSTGPSEGKSLTTANLAIVFAQQGKKVLLIDADLRKPTVHYTFRLNNTFGLSNYLVGDYELEKTVQKTNVDNLDIMTCGPIPPNPSELLGSKSMKKLLENSQEIYDIVIFDTPPVLAVTDSQILSNLVDGVLLVVRSKQTEKEAAKRAKDLLEKADANILGAVLNDRDVKEGGYYYYYGK